MQTPLSIARGLPSNCTNINPATAARARWTLQDAICQVYVDFIEPWCTYTFAVASGLPIRYANGFLVLACGPRGTLFLSKTFPSVNIKQVVMYNSTTFATVVDFGVQVFAETTVAWQATWELIGRQYAMKIWNRLIIVLEVNAIEPKQCFGYLLLRIVTQIVLYDAAGVVAAHHISEWYS